MQDNRCTVADGIVWLHQSVDRNSSYGSCSLKMRGAARCQVAPLWYHRMESRVPRYPQARGEKENTAWRATLGWPEWTRCWRGILAGIQLIGAGQLVGKSALATVHCAGLESREQAVSRFSRTTERYLAAKNNRHDWTPRYAPAAGSDLPRRSTSP